MPRTATEANSLSQGGIFVTKFLRAFCVSCCNDCYITFWLCSPTLGMQHSRILLMSTRNQSRWFYGVYERPFICPLPRRGNCLNTVLGACALPSFRILFFYVLSACWYVTFTYSYRVYIYSNRTVGSPYVQFQREPSNAGSYKRTLPSHTVSIATDKSGIGPTGVYPPEYASRTLSYITSLSPNRGGRPQDRAPT